MTVSFDVYYQCEGFRGNDLRIYRDGTVRPELYSSEAENEAAE